MPNSYCPDKVLRIGLIWTDLDSLGAGGSAGGAGGPAEGPGGQEAGAGG